VLTALYEYEAMDKQHRDTGLSVGIRTE